MYGDYYSYRDQSVYVPRANERWHYNETSSLTGWVHTQNDPCSYTTFIWCLCCIMHLIFYFYHLTSRIKKMAAVTIFMKTKPCRMLLLEDLSGWLIHVPSFFHFWWCCWNILRYLVNITMVTDALPACVITRSSAVMVLTIQDKWVFVFFEGGFGLPVSSHC